MVTQVTPPPVINAVASYQDMPNHHINPGQIVTVPVTQLSIFFSEEMDDPLGSTDPNDVTNPANYLLVGDGGHGTIATTKCTAASPADAAYTVNPIFYGGGVATLNLNGGTKLPGGKYRLLVCGTLQNTQGQALAPYSLDFSVDTTVPSVTLINSVADTGDGVLSENEATTVAITQLLVTFSEAVNATDAGSTASYRLIGTGALRKVKMVELNGIEPMTS